VTRWATCGAWPTCLREYRGDSHTAAWISAGFKAPEIGLLSELYWGLPLRTYVRTRAWSRCPARRGRGPSASSTSLIDDGGLTDLGRTFRENIEVATDRQCEVIVRTLGDAAEELIDLLVPWGQAIRDASGYPPQGPHDLAPIR
jgi:hypothetical protein